MSGDPTYIVTDVTDLVQVVILVVGIYSALGLRKGFVDAAYRSRALWSTLLMTVIAITIAEGFVPVPGGLLGNLVGFLPFAAIIGVSFAFIDRTVLVAMSSDFFHRDTLRWSQIRTPASAVLAASFLFLLAVLVVGFQLLNYGSAQGEPFWLNVAFTQFILVSAGILGLGAVAAIVGSRRTPDMTLKRSIRLLGSALMLFVLSLVVYSVSSSDAATILGDFLTTGATYAVYLSVKSLTPLGKVSKDA
ncbi:MAG: hypothetical protein OK449_02785 [Thaumarchaeota archaeon]|nr:hypothetical protein [Nitrososphaerota archaeon]